MTNLEAKKWQFKKRTPHWMPHHPNTYNYIGVMIVLIFSNDFSGCDLHFSKYDGQTEAYKYNGFSYILLLSKIPQIHGRSWMRGNGAPIFSYIIII